MKIYHFTQNQFLPISPGEAWTFFSNPHNLGDITPAGLRFQIKNIGLDAGIYEGQMIHYRIRILPFVWVTWLTEITKVKHHAYFIDDQRIGPYALWHHQHHFREVDGGVEMHDAVTYAVPFGFLGTFAHRVFVRGQLRGIFSHRRSVLEKKFKANLNAKELIL